MGHNPASFLMQVRRGRFALLSRICLLHNQFHLYSVSADWRCTAL